MLRSKKRGVQGKKKKASSLYFPWFSPRCCGIPRLLSFPTECPKAPFFSARCVDSVTDTHPFSRISLCVFKQLENTSVLAEIVTIIRHYQPHGFSRIVFYLTFFLTKTWARFGFGQAICTLKGTQNTNIILGFYSSQRCIQRMIFSDWYCDVDPD